MQISFKSILNSLRVKSAHLHTVNISPPPRVVSSFNWTHHKFLDIWLSWIGNLRIIIKQKDMRLKICVFSYVVIIMLCITSHFSNLEPINLIEMK